MTTKEEKIKALQFIGLTDQKIQETTKNEAITNILVEIVEHVSILLTFSRVHSLQ